MIVPSHDPLRVAVLAVGPGGEGSHEESALDGSIIRRAYQRGGNSQRDNAFDYSVSTPSAPSGRSEGLPALGLLRHDPN